eukprot:TRINITY_DN21260_c0_g1_i1.p1 TRINITY_DN21260_c0_g1~~TRINITY_DN21260_c0_g1_i1.p1  ORF type:complete len:295 (+),score=41.06 TRINITY_DN21260_c0_g1_i1:43-927(+)
MLRIVQRTFRRCYHDDIFDEGLDEVMGPPLNYETGDNLAEGVRQYKNLCVRVGDGTGCLFRMDRDNRTRTILRGEIAVLTSTRAIAQCKGTKHMVRTIPKVQGEDNESNSLGVFDEAVDLPVQAVYMQKKISVSESTRTGSITADHGLTIIKLPRAVQQHFAKFSFPTIGPPIRNGYYLYSASWDTQRNVVVGNQGTIDCLLPTPGITEFGPGEWSPSFTGSPLFMSDTMANPPKGVKQAAHKDTSVKLIGAVAENDHSDPYNPIVRVASLNYALMFPMAQATWTGSRWKVDYL